MAFPVACYPKSQKPLSVPFVGPLDGYATGLGGAYSVARRLLSSYTGALIRVRRDSDGTEADIGFTADGLLDYNALSAFAGAASAFVVIIYDQSGLGRDVTCASLSAQFRIVDTGVLEVVGSNGRLCAYSVNTGGGPYTSEVFTTNTSATLSVVGSFFMSAATLQAGGARYLSFVKDNGQDYDNPNAIMIFARQGTNARLNTYSNLVELGSRDLTLGSRISAFTRLTGTQAELNIGDTSATSAFSSTIGFNRIILSGLNPSSSYSEAGDRQMEHVLWQTDIGATAAAAIRAEQEAFYA